jgi:hypothetical protein
MSASQLSSALWACGKRTELQYAAGHLPLRDGAGEEHNHSRAASAARTRRKDIPMADWVKLTQVGNPPTQIHVNLDLVRFILALGTGSVLRFDNNQSTEVEQAPHIVVGAGNVRRTS